MALAQGSRHSISFVSESTFGTTPGSPTMLEFRNSGTTLGTEKDTFVSEVIRDDRQIVDMRHGVKKVMGDISFELAYGVHDTIIEAALGGTWATNVLKAGTSVRSFTIERAHADVTQYRKFAGCMIDEMTLDIKPNAMVTGKFSIVGKSESISGTSLGSATAGVANYPFDGFNGSISEGGSAVDNVTALSLSVKNNLAPQYVVGLDSTPQILMGQSNITGSVTAFFESSALLNKFLNETESSLSVTLEGSGTKTLTILLPRIKYTGAGATVTNANDGIFLEMPFQALRDGTEASNIKITRVP